MCFQNTPLLNSPWDKSHSKLSITKHLYPSLHSISIFNLESLSHFPHYLRLISFLGSCKPTTRSLTLSFILLSKLFLVFYHIRWLHQRISCCLFVYLVIDNLPPILVSDFTFNTASHTWFQTRDRSHILGFIISDEFVKSKGGTRSESAT